MLLKLSTGIHNNLPATNLVLFPSLGPTRVLARHTAPFVDEGLSCRGPAGTSAYRYPRSRLFPGPP